MLRCGAVEKSIVMAKMVTGWVGLVGWCALSIFPEKKKRRRRRGGEKKDLRFERI